MIIYLIYNSSKIKWYDDDDDDDDKYSIKLILF